MITVSIITPVFNRYDKLIATINSVQKQTFRDYEHIIIDDSSTDPLPNELEELISNDKKITFIKRSWNAGPAVTRNRGIDKAKGRFIAFLDADDLWHPEKLEKQIGFMLKNNFALTYTSFDIIDSNGKKVGKRTAPKKLNYKDILKCNKIGCLTAIYDSNILGKVYMPNIDKRQDMGLWLKILKKTDAAFGITNQSLARYRVGGTSLSSNKLTVLKY